MHINIYIHTHIYIHINLSTFYINSSIYIYIYIYIYINLSIYQFFYSCNNEKSKFVKKLFVNLITVAVFYCRYVIDKDIVESFYK